MGICPRILPPICLENLKIAYVNRDLSGYEALFSADFLFIFSPADVLNPINPTPSQWGVAEEDSSAARMFRSPLVDKVELDVSTGHGGEHRFHIRRHLEGEVVQCKSPGLHAAGRHSLDLPRCRRYVPRSTSRST